MPSSVKDRHPLNKRDFYINYGDCISCGVPRAEAPDLIEHDKEKNHCYFKKQPQTEMELDQPISALMVSCINALRYGGTEEKILKRLYEDGMADLCDHKPQKKYPALIRDRVSFNFDGVIDELANFLIQKYLSIGSHVTLEKLTNDGSRHFTFVKRWTGGACGFIYSCSKEGDGSYALQLTAEKEIGYDGLIGTSALLHDFLKIDNRITNIKWSSLNWPAGVFYDKPY